MFDEPGFDGNGLDPNEVDPEAEVVIRSTLGERAERFAMLTRLLVFEVLDVELAQTLVSEYDMARATRLHDTIYRAINRELGYELMK